MTHNLHGEECGRERRRRRRGEDGRGEREEKEVGMSGRWKDRKSNDAVEKKEYTASFS